MNIEANLAFVYEQNARAEQKQSGKSKKGGARKGAGRPMGAASQKTREIANRCALEGKTPLEVMLEAMREFMGSAHELKAEDPIAALEAFKEAAEIASRAAPYIHPRLAAIEHTGANGESLNAAPSAVLVVPQVLDQAAWAAAAAQVVEAEEIPRIVEQEAK